MGVPLQPSRTHIGSSRPFHVTGAAFAEPAPVRRGDLAISSEQAFDVGRFLDSSSETILSKFQKAECIFAQGDQADSVFYIREGKVKLIVVSNKGKEATIGVIGTGDFCGEGCLAVEPVRFLTATAMTSSSVLRIPRNCFLRLLNGNNEFSAAFTKFLVSRTLRVQQDLVDQRFHPSEYRLARLLVSLSTGPGRIPRISQETLASMVGTTRSRISFFLNKFKKAGLIEYSGGIRINQGLADLVRNQ
jgi:CRP/FNR family transcriptional regulator, cyclic AMP receptor protein